MTSWINWLFKSGNVAASPVIREGEVCLEGDSVIYSPKKGYRTTLIDLARLQYVYIYTTENSQNLVLNDYHQHFIPYSVNGFESFLKQLAIRLSLDEKQLLEILADKKPRKVELWRANTPDNCLIIDFPDHSDPKEKKQCEGFWICSSPRQWISWNMTSQELEDLPLTYQTTNEYGLTEIRFRFPVQIGNLLLHNWRHSYPGHLRLDVPLDDFYSNVRIQGNGVQNYLLVKKALEKIWGEAATVYERDDQNSCQWIVDGIKFALIYWHDSRFSYESGYAYLNVKNQRTYPDYLTNADYELNIQLTKSFLLERSFRIGSDFRRSAYFQQTPRKVVSQLKAGSARFIIWLDKLNGKIGFANLENAMIFPIENVASFQCQNVVPDRSSGGAYLSAILKQNAQHCVLIGDCYSFDAYVQDLAEMTRLPISELTTCE
jgi:hypothetical protein